MSQKFNIYDDVYYKGNEKTVLKYDNETNMYFITWLFGTWVNECELTKV